MNIKEYAEILLKLPEEWLQLDHNKLEITSFGNGYIASHPEKPAIELKTGCLIYFGSDCSLS